MSSICCLYIAHFCAFRTFLRQKRRFNLCGASLWRHSHKMIRERETALDHQTLSRSALDLALPHVLNAPKTDAAVVTLCLRPALSQRQILQSLRFSRSQGVHGDLWKTLPWLRDQDGNPHPDIQVSILPQRVLDLVRAGRDNLPHPGDTIIADFDTSTANLPIGTLIRAGSGVFRVSAVPNLGCVKWKVYYGEASLRWIQSRPDLRLRGVLCAIEQDGEIAVGDRLQVLR